MAQNIFIIQDPLNGDIIADVYYANIWTNDQTIVWKILVEGIGWSKKQVNGPIQFAPGWQGSNPEPIGPAPGPDEFDRRIYTSTGPGPVATAEGNSYTFFYSTVTDDSADLRGGHRRGNDIAVDPDIWNQPQP
jgi:hypothetical protein